MQFEATVAGTERLFSIKGEQEREIQTLQEKLNKSQAETAAKAQASKAQFPQEKALLKK